MEEELNEAGRMAERRGDALWLLFAGDVVARCGDDIDQKRTRRPPVPHPVRCCERVRRRAAGDGVDGEGIRRSRKRGEELAKIAAASFALVLSLPSLLLALLLCLPLPPEEGEGRGEAGRMTDTPR